MKIFFFLILGLSFLSCNNERKTRIPTDFEITIWEEDFGQVQAMAGTLSRDVDGKPYVAKFSLSDNEKLKIYNSISYSGILKLENDYNPTPNCVGMNRAFYLMRIVNGDFVRNVNVSNCDYGFIKNLQAKRYLNVIHSILTLVQKKPEVANVPRSEVIRF
jgi:hypothetical protein